MTRRTNRAGRTAARALVCGLDPATSVAARAEMLVEFASTDVETLRRARTRIECAALERPTALADDAIAALNAAIAFAQSTAFATTPPAQDASPPGAP